LDDHRIPHLATCYHRPQPFFAPLDHRDTDAIRELFADDQPDVTYFAAGSSSVEFAQDRSEEVRDIFLGGLNRVLDCLAETNGQFVLFSGDGVFGECRAARREEDPLAPVGKLAELQAEAEELVRTRLPERHLILRTSRVFGASAIRALAKRLKAGHEIAADNDRFTQPTYAPDLAEVALELVRRGTRGTIHATGPDRMTDFAFARLVAHLFGQDADRVEVAPEQPGLRPANVRLDRFRLRSLLGANAVRPVAEALRQIRSRQLQPALARAA
jgi:dTDP-4-dehydrorhamnose reductase